MKKARGLSVFAAAAMTVTTVFNGVSVSGAEASEPVKAAVTKLRPMSAVSINDTDGDGLNEFEGFGTSLCWWANRVGYSEELTDQAAKYFYGDDGLRMNIGRYNVGGGDHTTAPQNIHESTEKVVRNENAYFYDLSDFGTEEGASPRGDGSSMSVGRNSNMVSVKYTSAVEDFGFNNGDKVGSFDAVGWINELEAEPGSGGNLFYTVNAAKAGNYKIKLLLTLTGSNERGMAIRVNGEKKYIVPGSVINKNMIASGNNNMLFIAEFDDVTLNEGENTVRIGGHNGWGLDFVQMAVIPDVGNGNKEEKDDPFLHADHITRSDSVVPGYAVDVTKMDKEKSDQYYDEHFDQHDADCGYAWNYDWNADKNQINVVKAALRESGDEFIAEAFSNSPPYFMTYSGCSSGAENANDDNLRADSYHAFALYMADVIEHWNENGIKFQSTDPMNEPYTNYWAAYSNKQEGCHFDQGESQSKIINELNDELEKRGIDIVLSGTDETSIDTQITSFKKLDDEAKKAVERIDTHTYSGSNRAGLKAVAEEAGKNLWMSEVDGTFRAGTDAGEMTSALGLAERMMTDINGLGANAWILWNAIDMHADSELSKTTQDYKNIDALLADVDESKGFWGIAFADHDNKKVYLSKKYYGFGQISRYIRPGYSIIPAGNDTGVIAAYDKKGKKAVIVALNTDDEDEKRVFDLSQFASMGREIQAVRTSGTLENGENWADVSDSDEISANTKDRKFTALLKANSITTYIVDGVTYDGKEHSEKKEFTESDITANDGVLYLVNCGSTGNGVYSVPSGYRMGVYQSETNQEYAEDPETGLAWGYEPNDENSVIVNGGSGTSALTDTYIYMDPNASFKKNVSGFRYKFALPKRDGNDYTVTIGVKNPWDTRSVDVELEGEKAARNVSLVKGNITERSFDVKVEDQELNLMIHNPKRKNSGEDPVLSYIIVSVKKDTHVTYDSITGTAGERMYDTNGNKIQAHGGQIQKFTVNGETKYFWYGEDKTDGQDPVTGVHLYTSKDLYNWEDEGIALRTIVPGDDYDKYSEDDYKADLSVFEKDDYFKKLYGEYKGQKADDSQYSSKLEETYWNLAGDRCVIERPKVIYNEKTDKYVMWFHADGMMSSNRKESSRYSKARAGVAISDSPEGPFRLIGCYKLAESKDADLGWDTVHGSVRDMNLFVDDDGDAYVYYSSDGNQTMYAARLNSEYTGIAGNNEGTGLSGEALEKSDFTRNFIGASREAPAPFKYKDKYYIITSACTGWSPNKASYATADHPLGPWTTVGDPCEGDTKGTTFDTQSTCVFPVDAKAGKYVYMGDRWHNPDYGGDLSDSRYVWIPVEFTPGDGIVLKSYENWTLDDLENKGTFEVDTKSLPAAVSDITKIEEKLPKTVRVDYGNGYEDEGVIWTADTSDEDKLGMISITGTLEKSGRTFVHETGITDGQLRYFFDCGADGESEYFDVLKNALGDKLINSEADRRYTEGNGGYIGTLKSENDKDFDLGHYSGDNYLSNGWWAGSNRDIVYGFDLPSGEYKLTAGFQEWWNTSRPTKITITDADGKKLAVKNFTLSGTAKDQEVHQAFTLEKEGKVTVTISKTGSADPVLSFIGIRDTNAKHEVEQEPDIPAPSPTPVPIPAPDPVPVPEKDTDTTSQNEAVARPVNGVIEASAKPALLTAKNKYKINPAFSVKKYEITNRKIVSVTKKGIVKAKKSGVTTVVAVGKKGERTEYKLIVEKPVMKKLTVKAAGTYTLSDMLKDVTYSQISEVTSSDTSVAEVTTDGKITVKKAGSTKITVVIDGRKYSAKLKAIIK